MAGIRTLLKLGFFFVLLLIFVGRQGDCFPVTAKDDRGKEVEFKEQPRRIVSLVPTQTELLFSLGLGKRVVGVTNYCNYPEAANQKEKIGGFAEIDSEKIRALKPDLILSFGTIQFPATEKLEKSGMKVFWMYPHTVSEILASIERVGEITGARREAEHLRRSLEKDIRVLRGTLGTIPDEKRPTVFRVMTVDPPATIGAESFQSDLFYLAGGRNAFADVRKDYFQVDARELRERNPDFIVMCGDDEAEAKQSLQDSPDFKDLAAVKNDAVLIIPCDLTCRPGPRIVETAARIARVLHREKFSDKR